MGWREVTFSIVSLEFSEVITARFVFEIPFGTLVSSEVGYDWLKIYLDLQLL